jgi:hypothetical protein
MDFVSSFGHQISRLSLPLQLVTLDPLITQAQEWVLRTASGAQEVVGAVESQLLRAPSNGKTPIIYFVDAMVRSTKSPATPVLRDMISRNLEVVFCSAFLDADDSTKSDMLKMVRIWEGTPSRPPTFSGLVLQRIRARVDPHYRGPPIESLPSLRLPARVTYAPAPPPPPPPPTSIAYPFAAPPSFAPRPAGSSYPPLPGADAVLQRAAELLALLLAQIGRPASVALGQVQLSDRLLFDRLMAQAASELQFPPPPATTYAPQPGPRPDSEAALAAALVASLVVSDEATYRNLHHSRLSTREDRSTTRARSWYPSREDWASGRAAAALQLVTLFQQDAPLAAAEARDAELDPHAFAVPKDASQPACALSGEAFEAFYSDELSSWMYASAVRPDPDGPIYNVHAWTRFLQQDNPAASPKRPRWT